MISGVVLDPSTIAAFGRGQYEAMFAIDEVDMRSHVLLIPITAMTEALTQLSEPAEVQHAVDLMDFGVAVDISLTRDSAESVATAYVTAEDRSSTSLGMAHAAVTALERGWKVLTNVPKRWQAAHPDTAVKALTS